VICPHCNYETGWSPERQETVEGKSGDFYELPIKVERPTFYHNETLKVYGCPACKKLFID